MVTVTLRRGVIELPPAASTAYARALVHFGGKEALLRASNNLPLAAPVNDVLSLVPRPDLAERLTDVWGVYGIAGLVSGDPTSTPTDMAGLRRFTRQAAKWEKAGEREHFLAAARKVARGRWPNEIAEHLTRVVFRPGRQVEVPDLLALAAWALDQTLRKDQAVTVKRCALCKIPYVSTSGRSRYCRRTAPSDEFGEKHRSCRDIAKVRDFRARQRKGTKDGQHRRKSNRQG